MQLLVARPGVLKAVPVALSLHKQRFHLVLTLISILPEPSQFVVFHCVSEIVQAEITHLLVVAIWELNVARLHCVVKETKVTGCSNLNTVAHKVAIELHQQAAKRKVVRRDAVLVVLVVCIPERGVEGRLEERVESVHADQRLVLVSPVKLLKNLTKRGNRDFRIVDADVHDLNQLFGISQLVR